MSLLNSAFDIVSVDNPVAVAALAIVLDADTTLVGSPVFNTNGTPNVGTVAPGTIVTMSSTGKAVATTTPGNIVTNRVTAFKPLFVVIDGNTDYSGAFTNRLTCLQGGFTMATDQFTAPGSGYTPGLPVTYLNGKINLAAATDQVMGFVGPAGYDATAGTVQVMVPQGLGI